MLHIFGREYFTRPILLQNSSGDIRLAGDRSWTAIFKSFQRCSVRSMSESLAGPLETINLFCFEVTPLCLLLYVSGAMGRWSVFKVPAFLLIAALYPLRYFWSLLHPFFLLPLWVFHRKAFHPEEWCFLHHTSLLGGWYSWGDVLHSVCTKHSATTQAKKVQF